MAIIAIDFDGTIVKHAYPDIGEAVDKALQTIRRLRRDGNQIILHTMRSGDKLEEAVSFLKNAGIDLYGVNENPRQGSWTSSPKPYAHLYIDDASAGCPVIEPEDARPFADWDKIIIILEERGYVQTS